MTMESAPVDVLVVSDDVVLGELIASNLRRRGLGAERAALAEAPRDGWRPGGAPRLLIVSIEAPERAALAQVRQLLRRPWALGVPCVLAVEPASALGRRAGALAACPLVRPYDIGAIVAAARALLARPLPA